MTTSMTHDEAPWEFPAGVVVPPGVRFEDVELHEGSDGRAGMTWAPFEKVCYASGLDPEQLLHGAHAALVPAVLAGWLDLLAARGEAPVGEDHARGIIERMAKHAAEGEGGAT